LEPLVGHSLKATLPIFQKQSALVVEKLNTLFIIIFFIFFIFTKKPVLAPELWLGKSN
jgi:hypothetical protein